MTIAKIIKVETIATYATTPNAVRVHTAKGVFEMTTTPNGTSVLKIGAERVAQSIREKGTFDTAVAQTKIL